MSEQVTKIKERIGSIDVLRGLSMFLLMASGEIGGGGIGPAFIKLFNMPQSVIEQFGYTKWEGLRLHTFAADVTRSGRKIKNIITASKSGFEEWQADVFIDCTGDGDVAALAGCGYHMGRESDGQMQPGTTYGLVGGWEGGIPNQERINGHF